MPSGRLAGVPVRCVASMGVLESLRHSPCGVGNDDQMHVIGHQAVAQQGEAVKLRRLPQQVQVRDAISVVRQDYLAGVAALRNVVGDIYDDHARQASHSQKIAEIIRSVSGSYVFARRWPPAFPYWSPETRERPVCPQIPQE